MQRLIFLLPILLLQLVLGGCTVLKGQDDEYDLPKEASCTPYKAPSRPDSTKVNIEKQLLAAAESIETSLGILAAAQKAESPPTLNTAPLVTPEGGMGGMVDIDWTGPVGPLVDKIASMTSYRVKFLGNEPAIPIIVTISAKRAIIAEVLQNASLQAGKRAQILVFPANHVIEVRYLS